MNTLRPHLHRRLPAAGWLCLALVLGGLLLSSCSVPAGSDGARARGPHPDSQEHKPGKQENPGKRDKRDHKDKDRKPGNRSGAARGGDQSERTRTWLVTHVVDGDTVDLANGETVRLVGIDTPEVGRCGYERATVALVRLVEGRRVRLVRSDEDRDGYGRLLRYVDIGEVDAGLRLIRSGLAIARYDSRDGYGRHPREATYVAVDRANPDLRCAPAPRPQHVAAGGGCHGYAPCLPAYPPDLDCPDVDGPVRVTGPDPHGLDGDDDGVACE